MSIVISRVGVTVIVVHVLPEQTKFSWYSGSLSLLGDARLYAAPNSSCKCDMYSSGISTMSQVDQPIRS